MSLNTSKGNMYEWVTHTWNPANGTCEHDCSYCYVKRGPSKGWRHDIKLTRAIDDALGIDKVIFVCSQTDLWGTWVLDKLIMDVLAQCRRYNKNTYLFQSKNPMRFAELIGQVPQHSIFCTTIETNRDTSKICKAPGMKDRFAAMKIIKGMGFKISVTIEPIMNFDTKEFVDRMKSIMPDWVSIGADSKHAGLKEPGKEKVLALVKGLNDAGIKIEQKRNLGRILNA